MKTLLKTLKVKKEKIDGDTLAYYVKKLAFEDASKYLLNHIGKYIISITPDELFEIIKNLVHVLCQVLAGKTLLKLVKPALNDEMKEKILSLVVFNRYRNMLEKILNGEDVNDI